MPSELLDMRFGRKVLAHHNLQQKLDRNFGTLQERV